MHLSFFFLVFFRGILATSMWIEGMSVEASFGKIGRRQAAEYRNVAQSITSSECLPLFLKYDHVLGEKK